MPNPHLQPRISPADYRHNCGRLLFRGLLVQGTEIQIRCTKCRKMVVIQANSTAVIRQDVPDKVAFDILPVSV